MKQKKTLDKKEKSDNSKTLAEIDRDKLKENFLKNKGKA